MTKKVYRRLLIVAIMLLSTASLTYTSPAQTFRSPCCEACDLAMVACWDEGRTGCRREYTNCLYRCGGLTCEN